MKILTDSELDRVSGGEDIYLTSYTLIEGDASYLMGDNDNSMANKKYGYPVKTSAKYAAFLVPGTSRATLV